MMSQHELLKEFIRSLVKGNNTALIIKGEPGIGKSETIMDTLRQLGYEKNTHYKYINNFSAPYSFYKFLEKSENLQNPKLVILDDVEEFLKQSKIVSILRSALWAVDGKRQVGWISGNKKSSFEFTGKIVIVLNRFDERVNLLNTIKDRSLFYEIRFTQDELISLMRDRATNMPYSTIEKEKRLEICEYVIQRSFDTKLSLRDLQKGYDLFLGSPENWKILLEKQYTNE